MEEYKRILGDEFQKKELRRTTLFYKKGYDFLDEGTSIGRGDIITPSSPEPARLLQYKKVKAGVKNEKEGKFLYDYTAKREVYIEQQTSSECGLKGGYDKLLNLCKKKFKHVKFENIIGFKTPQKYENSDSIYHTYTDGLNFWGLTSEIPKQLKEELENVVAEGLKELHDNKIEYFHPLPMNMRYNFDGKLILNPHQNIEFNFRPKYPLQKTKRGVIIHFLDDIAKLIYTHDWIDNPERFVEKYLGEDINTIDTKTAMGYIKQSMESMEQGEYEGLPFEWGNLGKIKVTNPGLGHFISNKKFKELKSKGRLKF